MQRIDFLGVAGSGKTTIVKIAEKNESLLSQSASADLAAYRALDSKHRYSLKRRLMSRIPYFCKPLFRNDIEAGERKAFARFA